MTGDKEVAPSAATETQFDVEAPKASKSLHIVGFVITGLWLVGLVSYCVWARDDFATLEPNALGDFASGAFAPLAFLWLVLGFFQQGEELRYSGRALWLQGRELQHSVEQQRELVNVTREQLKFEGEALDREREEIARHSRPLFELVQGGNSPATEGIRSHDFLLYNHGKNCTRVRVAVVEGGPYVEHPKLASGEHISFRKDLPIGPIEPFSVTVTCVDERLMPSRQTYTVSGEGRFKIEWDRLEQAELRAGRIASEIRGHFT